MELSNLRSVCQAFHKNVRAVEIFNRTAETNLACLLNRQYNIPIPQMLSFMADTGAVISGSSALLCTLGYNSSCVDYNSADLDVYVDAEVDMDQVAVFLSQYGYTNQPYRFNREIFQIRILSIAMFNKWDEYGEACIRIIQMKKRFRALQCCDFSDITVCQVKLTEHLGGVHCVVRHASDIIHSRLRLNSAFKAALQVQVGAWNAHPAGCIRKKEARSKLQTIVHTTQSRIIKVYVMLLFTLLCIHF